MTVRIGTAGWNYDAWVGPFYPAGTRVPDMLATYARAFDTVEVDSTFYAIPSTRTVRGWADRTPPDFRFALKVPQAITHDARFRGTAARDATVQFCDRVRELGEKLGPILIQCAPDFGPAEYAALGPYLDALPAGIAYAIEFRDARWFTDERLRMLRTHGVGIALTDARWVPRETMLAQLAEPSPLTYIRFIGEHRELTDFSRTQIDRRRALARWAEMMGAAARQSAWIYFNNHFSGHSPHDGRSFQRLLGQHPVEPSDLQVQGELF